MKKGYNIMDLVMSMKGNDITTFIEDQHHRFTERFGLSFDDKVSVTLKFETGEDAMILYNELKLNPIYASQYTITTTPLGSRYLEVSGAETLFDYFGTVEPNLLTLSRDCRINFEIFFTQDYTGIVFTGAVHYGELLSRQCVVEMSPILPELSLGGLHQIARSHDEFESLLTRCYIIKGETI